MLERPKIFPGQQPRSLEISPSDVASKSLGVKIENGEVTRGEGGGGIQVTWAPR